jgi:hypothetical protein
MVTTTNDENLTSDRFIDSPIQNNLFVVDGKEGVHIKHYERVVTNLLHHVEPKYVNLPNNTFPVSSSSDWPYDILPNAARVRGTLPGQLSNPIRALRKENQIRSMLRCIISLLPKQILQLSTNDRLSSEYTFVDFGGGSGHLSIPLALLFPQCNVICVDLGRYSLNLLHTKAALYTGQHVSNNNIITYETSMMDEKLRSTSIPNLQTYFGAAHTFTNHSFHMAIALHLCGEATDVVLQLAGTKQVPSIVVAPCCVGKLSSSANNPYVYQASGSNFATIRYPQSTIFRTYVQQADDWNALAQAADFGDTNTNVENDYSLSIQNGTYDLTGQHRMRKMAKSLLETDRCLYLNEVHGYSTKLMQMKPSDASPKNDIIAAWIPHSFNQTSCYCSNDESVLDTGIAITPNHPTINTSPVVQTSNRIIAATDWSSVEEQEIRQQLKEYINMSQRSSDYNKSENNITNGNAFIFPTCMGSRRRKLIHCVATELNLRHWSVGKKNADKTVAVEIR